MRDMSPSEFLRTTSLRTAQTAILYLSPAQLFRTEGATPLLLLRMGSLYALSTKRKSLNLMVLLHQGEGLRLMSPQTMNSQGHRDLALHPTVPAPAVDPRVVESPLIRHLLGGRPLSGLRD